MRITLFTSNQPRHSAFIKALLPLCETLYVIQEVTTIFPGEVADFFRVSSDMQSYFKEVIAAERRIFKSPLFIPPGPHMLTIYPGDLKHLKPEMLGPAATVDFFIVFGTRMITGALCEYLVAKQAINLHMGIAPFYRGASCNMWALYDDRPDLVGATIHLLSPGLDSGDILFQVLPPAQPYDQFDLGMVAVAAAQNVIVNKLRAGTLLNGPRTRQETLPSGRLCKQTEFTDDIARKLLEHPIDSSSILYKLQNRNLTNFISPIVDTVH